MKKKRIFIFSVITLCVLLLCTFLLLSSGTPAKRPNQSPNQRNAGTGTDADGTGDRKDRTNGTRDSADGTGDKANKTGDRLDDTTADQDEPIVSTDRKPARDSNIHVRKSPIALDPKMDTHLAEFCRKAKQLQQDYPHSFLISLPAKGKKVALTFDDGPDGSSMPKILDILNHYQVPGTFFFIGQQMKGFPETIQRAQAEGHVLANHSWSHIRPTDVRSDTLMGEVQRTQDVLAHYGTKTKFFRPFGLVTKKQMTELIQAGFQTVAWSIDSMDWYFDNPDDIVTCVVENIHPGAIVLMHSSGGPTNRRATIESLPIIIETLRAKGYRFVTLTDKT